MSLSGSIRMVLSICLYMSFQNTYSKCLYLILKEHKTQYAPVIISKNSPPYMSILQFPKMTLSIFLYLQSNIPFSTILNLGVNKGFKDAPLFTPIFVGQIFPLSITIAKSLEGMYQGFKICPYLLAYIWVSIKVPLCMPISGFPKNAALYMPIPYFARMPHSICLYFHLKDAPQYDYVRFSIYVSIYMVCKDTCLKCIYMVLRNAPMCMPLSVSLRMLLYICLNMSFKNT